MPVNKGLLDLVRSTIFSKFADMKSDEKTISALTAQAHSAEADKRTLQKKLAASERRVQDLEKRLTEQQAASDDKIRELTDKLIRAFNFALKEYPQLLRYLNDGRLAFSNNICELQMRQIAIYRNNSYFLGSVKSAKRFARLVSLTQSAKNCKRNVQKYFHDILNRVVVTVKDDLVSILPHKWVEPVTIPLVY